VIRCVSEVLVSEALASPDCPLAIIALSSSDDQSNTFTLPAEFEPQQAVWMSARPTENDKPVLDIVIEMVRALAPHVRIQLMVPTEDVKGRSSKSFASAKD